MAEEATPAPSEKEKTQAPKPRRKIPIIPIALLLQTLVILGAGGFIVKATLFTKRPNLNKQHLEERAIASIRDERLDIRVINLEQFNVNLPQRYILKTSLHIEVSNAETELVLRKRLAAIKSEILKVLSSQSSQKTASLLGKLALKDALREVINDELSQHGAKTGVVREVYFTDFVLVAT